VLVFTVAAQEKFWIPFSVDIVASAPHDPEKVRVFGRSVELMYTAYKSSKAGLYEICGMVAVVEMGFAAVHVVPFQTR